MQLFLNTSNDLTISILQKNELIDSVKVENSKISQVIHSEMYKIFKKNKKQHHELQEIVYFAGPGSYTGLRIGEGIARSFKVFGVKTYSVNISDIFLAYNLNNSIWLENAFKSQFYHLKYSNAELKEELLPINELNPFIEKNKKKKFYGNISKLKIAEDIKIHSFESIINLDQSKIVKYAIENNSQQKLKYFRPLNLEFNKK